MTNETQKWALYLDGELHKTNLTKEQADHLFQVFAQRDPHDEVELFITPIEPIKNA